MNKQWIAFACAALLLPALAPAPDVTPDVIRTSDLGNSLFVEFNTDISSLGSASILNDAGDELPLSLLVTGPRTFETSTIPAPIGPTLGPAPTSYRLRLQNVVAVDGSFTSITDTQFRFLAQRTPMAALRDSVSPTTGLTTFPGNPFLDGEGTIIGRIFPDTIFLEDQESGEPRGVQIRRPDLDLLDAAEGFIVRVRGRLGDDLTNGNLFVTANNVQVTPGRPRAPITPTVRRTIDLKEEIESTLVELSTETLGPRPNRGEPLNLYSGDTFYTISDAFGSALYYIPASSPLVGTLIPQGAFKVIGVVVQFDDTAPYTGNYAVVPRGLSDVVDLTASSAQHWDMYE